MKRFKIEVRQGPNDYYAYAEPVESPDGQWVDVNDRLTEAETAVLEAALAQTGPVSMRLKMALNRLRAERAIGQAKGPLARQAQDDRERYFEELSQLKDDQR